MKVLGHIHTFNDVDVIDESLAALRHQTRPLDRIIIVDNGSTDGTLERRFPADVTIIRHAENLGTNGAIRTGFEYALEHGFDWTWVFDADSAPQKDALERLLAFYDGLPAEEQRSVCFLGCAVGGPQTATVHVPLVLTPRGGEAARQPAGRSHMRCDVALWTGSLYRMEAVQALGLPSEHYVLDWGELEYGYRAKKYGFTSYVLTDCRVRHDLGGSPSLRIRTIGLGPIGFPLYEFPAVRCYYSVRNMIYFWLHESRDRGWRKILGAFYRSLLLTSSFLVRPAGHGAQIAACLRGIWDGLTGRIERRY